MAHFHFIYSFSSTFLTFFLIQITFKHSIVCVHNISQNHIFYLLNFLFKTLNSETAVERRRKDEQVRATIHQKLVDTGEKERLKALLRAKLEECGWRDELKAYCKEVIKNKGLEKITVEDLVQEITPRGRATVPSAIKAELLQRIRKFLQAN